MVGTYPDGQQEHITGFKTEADALDWLRTQPSRPRARVRGCYFGEIPISASSRIAVSVARPLSVGVYAPFSRLCAMNPRMATDCIACARMPAAPVYAGRDAEQNHAVLCAEFRRRLFHGLFPPPAFGEGRHRGLARRLATLRRLAILVMPEGQCPHPRRAYGRGVHLHDAADDRSPQSTSKSSSFHSPDERLADARLRTR